MSRDLELKFAVGPAFVLPDLTGAGSVARMYALPSDDGRATYWDTVDRRLARWGITLRHRTGNGEGPAWALTLPASVTAGGTPDGGWSEIEESSVRV